ncbi:MAG: 3-keto-5-aminohexanoate cleavage protein [Oricola sp.]
MTAGRRKIVISCAVTGAAHTPSMSEFLPWTPEQIAQQAIDAARAGAAVLHLDARDPGDGSPSHDGAIYGQFVPAIRAQTDAVIAVPTGGDLSVPLDERIAGALCAGPDIFSVDMGAVSRSYRKSGRGISDWKHGWEKPFVEGSDGRVHGNTLRDIRTVLARLGHGHGARFSFECHDPSHLYNLAHCIDDGLVHGPFFLQFHFGLAGGLGCDPENVHLMQATADRLFGRESYAFSVAAHGRRQLPLTVLAAIMGGHVRVGLADNLYLGKGLLAASCAAQVLKVRRILEDLSFEIASPGEARAILRADAAGAAVPVTGEAVLNG